MKDKNKTTDKIKLTLKEKWANYKQKKPELIKDLKDFGLGLLYFISLTLPVFAKLNCNILNVILIFVEFLYIAFLFGFWIYRKKYSYKKTNFYSVLTAHASLFFLVFFLFTESKIFFYLSFVLVILCLSIYFYIFLKEQFLKNQFVNNINVSNLISLCMVVCFVIAIIWYGVYNIFPHYFYCCVLFIIALLLIVCLLYLIFENRENEQIYQCDTKKSFFEKYFGITILIIVIIALVSYIIYQVFYNFDVNHTLFSSLMGIWACFLGGFLTLSGVAWTIKNQAKIFKEQEKIKNTPFVFLDKSDFNKAMRIDVISEKNDKYFIDPNSLKNVKIEKNMFIYEINPFKLKNSDNSNIILEKFIINGNEIRIQKGAFVEKGGYSRINFFPFFQDKKCEIKLLVKDMLGNNYYYNVFFDIEEKLKIPVPIYENGKLINTIYFDIREVNINYICKVE